VLRGPADDPARKALESGFQAVSHDVAPEPMVLEWGLGNGETADLSFAKKNDAIAVLDDRTARMAARVMGIQIVGTLGVVLRAHRTGRIQSAAVVIRTSRDAGVWRIRNYYLKSIT
jgi:predicted nucleic acid-binding protein